MRLRHMHHKTGRFISDNSPTLLTAAGVTGLFITTYLTADATFKYAELVRTEELERKNELAFRRETYGPQETLAPITGREMFELGWKLYIPAAIALTLSAAAVIGANRIGTRRAAAVTAAYAISERAYSEYKDKVIDTIGENKERKLRESLAQDRIDRHPMGEQQAIDTGGGKDLCYDSWNGRYFWASMEAIKQAQNRVNYKINNHFYASLTDFYDFLGLDRTKTSDDMGWGQSNQLEITFHTIVSNLGQPVLVMDFQVAPARGYERLY